MDSIEGMKLLRTEHTDHPRLDGAKRGPLTCELGAGFTGLPKDTFQQEQRAKQQLKTHSSVASIISCDSSMRPRSASKASAALDLYALDKI